ncbi:MAG: hypothetical protein IPN00_12420, partial [Hydrogenophilales bacterium]|nr:hypothetical protein [Hydrogenophilales bacterium]
MNAEMEIAGVDFGGVCVGEDRFEANPEFADAGGIVALVAGPNAGDGFDIFEREKPFAIVLKLDRCIGQK